MKHIKTFESFLNEANKTGEKITLKDFTDIDHSRLVKWMSSQFGPMKYNPGMEWVGGHLTKGGDFTLDVSGWDARDLKDLKAYLKSQYHVYESVKESELNELALSSAGVQGLLHAIYYNWDDIKNKIQSQFYFKSFRDVLQFIKSGDQEEQKELEDAVKGMGIEILNLDDKKSWDMK